MVNQEMKDLLKQLADLSYQASEEVYDDDKEDGTAGILKLCDELYEKIDTYLDRESELITKEMVEESFNNKIIQIRDNDEYGCMGLHCKIGSNGFYFGDDSKIVDMPIEEFWSTYSKNQAIDMIYNILKTKNSAIEYGLDEEEHEYYTNIIKEELETERKSDIEPDL